MDRPKAGKLEVSSDYFLALLLSLLLLRQGCYYSVISIEVILAEGKSL